MIFDSSNDVIDMICCTNDAAAFEPEETILVDELFEGNEHSEIELLDGSMQDVENAQSYCKYSERQDDEATFIDEENTSSSAVSLGIGQSIDKTLILQSSEDSAMLEEPEVSNISNEDDHTNQTVDLVDALVDTPPVYEGDPVLATIPVLDSIVVELSEPVIQVKELVVTVLYSMLYVSVCFYSSPFTL